MASREPHAASLLAIALHQTKEYRLAADTLEAALRIDSSSAKLHMLLSVSLLEMGNQQARGSIEASELYRRAIQAADRAIAIQKSLAPAHSVRGRAFKRLNQTDESLAAFREAI